MQQRCPVHQRLARTCSVCQWRVPHFTVYPPAPFVGRGHEVRVTWRGQDQPVAVPLPPLGPTTAQGRKRDIWEAGGGVWF